MVELPSLILEAPMFSDLTYREAETLARHMQVYRAEKGVVIFREGEPSDYLFLLLSGRVDIAKTDQSAESKSFAAIGPGKILGEMSMVDGECRSATCSVLESATLAVLLHESFLLLVKTSPMLGYKILLHIARQLSQRLRHTSSLLVDYLP